MLKKSLKKPFDPRFSSGPCKKYPTFTFDAFDISVLGRSHRSAKGTNLCETLIKNLKTVLEIPNDYEIAIVPGSAMGAVATLIWNLLGPNPVEALVTDAFSKLWYEDATQQLQLNVTEHNYFQTFKIPTLKDLDPLCDVLLTWNGTTSGVCLKKEDWMTRHKGLVVCDATSAVFCTDLPWDFLDATAFSFQKGLGSEAAHGVIVLSPKALKRLETYTPSWPIPKFLRLKTDEVIHKSIFKGLTINTPSMMVLNDMILALKWAKSQGGLSYLIDRVQKNFQVVSTWIEQDNVSFLSPEYLSPISPCLLFKNFDTWEKIQQLCQALQDQEIAYDVKGHKDAPFPCLRIWFGPTIEIQDLEDFLESLRVLIL
ncbi:MAG TPA: phosphoserine aminotransferase [Alphaproteobacteria bacterium]|nr:phosphoserine aminotransferase [Alphaproteobacteria bacterium]